MDRFQGIKTFMEDLTSWVIPGNSIAVYHDGKLAFSYQSGYADVENKIPMQGDELFHIYSCSKVATVVAALQLYERGKFLLDDPLYRFIPEFKNMRVRLGEGKTEDAKTPITMRQLFTMTAGFAYNTSGPWRKRAEERTNGRMDTLEVIRSLAEEPLYFQPGTCWAYSLCHDVLAAAVEVISGQRFADYVRTHIFEPLDMKSASYHTSAADYEKMPVQYEYVIASEADRIKLQMSDWRGLQGTRVRAPKENYLAFGEGYDSGGAGITSSVDDYAKFAGALAMGGKGNNGERILQAGTVDLLRSDQLTDPFLDRTSYDNWSAHKGYSYGLGVMTLTDRAAGGSNGSLGEFGWGGAAGGTVFVDPVRKIGYFYTHYMFNSFEQYYQPRLRNAVFSAF